MGYMIEMYLLSERIHNLSEFNRIPVIFRKVFFPEKEGEELVLSIRFF
jgi:hypothetical protein